MPLEVTVGQPVETDDPLFILISATVHDSESPLVAGVFRYFGDRSGETPFLWLTGIAIEHRADIPLGKRSRLPVAVVRNMPAARWETAARAHILQARGLRDLTPEETTHAAIAVGEALTMARVNRLYPELMGSDRPADIRKRESLFHLADISEEYEHLVRQGATDPAAAIARTREAKPSTVRSWLHRARRAGLLEVTSQQARKAISELPGDRSPVADTDRSENDGDQDQASEA